MNAWYRSGLVRMLVVCCIVGTGALVVYRQQHAIDGKERELHGSIVELVVPENRASLEFIHPRTGQPFKLSSTVSEACKIEIDGQPARLADLRLGDEVIVRGVYYRNGRINVESIRAHRAADPSSERSVRGGGLSTG